MRAGLLAIWSCLIVLGACAALAGPHVEPVVITFVGDSILSRGTRVPAVIAVSAHGTPVPRPRLVLSSSDPAIVAVTASGDSLAALTIGRATLTVRLESSILSDSMPALLQPLRVRP